MNPRKRRSGRRLDGWLVLDKPEGLTSAQAVARVRRLTGAAKAGHAGTLDPIATGVLPIALGEATKTVSYLMACPKAYRFAVRWGEARDTDDAAGKVVDRTERRPRAAEIRQALARFVGEIEQVPPDYSAVKVEGRRAYELARRAEKPPLKARKVRVERFALTRARGGRAEFEVVCGKGAYVRALVRDLAHALGTLGYVESLCRTAVGPFRLEDAISLEELEALVHNSELGERLFAVEAVLVDIPALTLTPAEAERLRHGQPVRLPRYAARSSGGTVCAMAKGRPVALAHLADGEMRPLRVFNL